MVSSLTAMQPMHDGAFSRYPDQKDFIDLAPEFGTRFTLFIDTEEEFDWHKPFSRTGSRSEEHTSELQSLMRISHAVFCLTKKTDRHASTNCQNPTHTSHT